MIPRSICLLASVLAFGSSLANAHGSHSTEQPASNDWTTKHMLGEHHIESFDALSFFTLHDYDDSGAWTPDEVRKTYGADHESNDGVSESRKVEAVREVFELFDPENTGYITRDAWTKAFDAGVRLPDLGLGPGHHGDIEYEYEIHHFEQFHGEDATAEELTHPEDIEHFKQHDELELAELRLEQLEQKSIVVDMIPNKFRRH
ncbi:hypothetical protein N7495_005254 [Penicillium taxi]|uniref:uncharacterized protein n=1 Tax=Penicillium taxi TaxID=168475 RepID=UPI002544E46A|nr:uncharacterized protein N7495_005254 [Penicillium taxi]KAJ5893563.1 hypothetical protein N7495_005254 [Penicillium taxi]